MGEQREELGSVLVVEDDAQLRFGMCGALRALGFDVREADSCESAMRAFTAQPDVIVTDLRLPDGDALDLLPRLRTTSPDTPVFIVTGYGTIDLAVRAVKQGAEDFLSKPVDMKVLGDFVKNAIRKRKPSLARDASVLGVYSPRSDAMKRVEEEVETLRNADCSVLLLGETGTGKSYLARRIHEIGARKSGPFIDVNCAGLTKEFFETELFGHERGAFTGAHASKAGLLDSADAGTLFLDEIGDVDAQVQPKLLKVLEEKRFRRMGDVRERSVDVRLIGATHRDLFAAINEGSFRIDLYYRVSTVTITVPPLRERLADLVPLTDSLLVALGRPECMIAPDAQARLTQHAWYGNLRELKNVLERALLLCNDGVIRAADLRFDPVSTSRMAAVAFPLEPTPYSTRFAEHTPTGAVASSRGRDQAPPSSSSGTLSEMERKHIEEALEAEDGRVEAAAKRLGMPRSTLYQRIKTHGITISHARLRRGASRSDRPSSSKKSGS